MRKRFSAGARGAVRQDGQAAVEFALVLPIVLVVAVAICQVVLALNCRLVLLAASREGARRAAETNDPGEARNAAIRAAAALPGGRPRVSVSFPEGRARGCPVEVELRGTVPLILPGLSRFLPPLEFRCSTWMALEKGSI